MSNFRKRMNAKRIENLMFDEMVLIHVVDPLLMGAGFFAGLATAVAVYVILRGAA